MELALKGKSRLPARGSRRQLVTARQSPEAHPQIDVKSSEKTDFENGLTPASSKKSTLLWSIDKSAESGAFIVPHPASLEDLANHNLNQCQDSYQPAIELVPQNGGAMPASADPMVTAYTFIRPEIFNVAVVSFEGEITVLHLCED